jgi:hypothetical protein
MTIQRVSEDSGCESSASVAMASDRGLDLERHATSVALIVARSPTPSRVRLADRRQDPRPDRCVDRRHDRASQRVVLRRSRGSPSR